MDNKAKIYTLYLALDDVVSSACHLMNDQPSVYKIKNEEFFAELLTKGKEYYHRKIDLSEINESIEFCMGQLEENNLDLIYPLWFAFNLALNKYFIIYRYSNNFEAEQETRLSVAYFKYEAAIQNSGVESDWWNNIKSKVEAYLGSFYD